MIGGTACTTDAPPKASRSETITAPRPAKTDAEFGVIPSPIPAARHGTLLKYFAVSTNVAEATTYKIMYASRSVNGAPIVVTGLAVVPDAPAAKGSRVVLTAGHGTTGLADVCAPSATPPRGLEGVAEAAVRENWIVAATDYEGLGTPGRHPYLVGVSEGRSVLDAALAAAQLPRANASNRVLIAGYSQGGHAALWANQIAAEWAPSLNVLGAFGGAPATEIDRILGAGRTLPIQRFVVAIVGGFTAAYPNADPSRYLTDEGVTLLDTVDTGCLPEIADAVKGIGPVALVRADGPTDPQWIGLAKRNNPGGVAATSPVLIIHSEQDEIVPAGLSAILHDRMCAAGQVVERRVISGGSHVRAAVPSLIAAFTWLRERVDAKQPPINDCA